MEWILIIFYSGWNMGGAIEAVEFRNETNCRVAMNALLAEVSDSEQRLKAVCVPKGKYGG